MRRQPRWYRKSTRHYLSSAQVKQVKAARKLRVELGMTLPPEGTLHTGPRGGKRKASFSFKEGDPDRGFEEAKSQIAHLLAWSAPCLAQDNRKCESQIRSWVQPVHGDRGQTLNLPIPLDQALCCLMKVHANQLTDSLCADNAAFWSGVDLCEELLLVA